MREKIGCRQAADILIHQNPTLLQSNAPMSAKDVIDLARCLPTFSLDQIDFIEGHIERYSNGNLEGWVRSPKVDTFRVPVTVTYAGKLVARTEASVFRATGSGDGGSTERPFGLEIPR
jgi:hypothetical protein